jgi:hypothetical protein
MTTEQREAAAMERYHAALHGVQTAVLLQIDRLGYNAAGADAKHLRTGINGAMSDHGALVGLLIEKGVFSSVEYLEAIASQMETELARISADTRRKCGLPDKVTFG